MYVNRYLNPVIIYFYTWRMVLISLGTGLFAIYMYDFVGKKWMAIPWLPVSLIGTALAFYVGFKNNQAYDRSWEARKIWGGIVNLSRSFTVACKGFIGDGQGPAEEVKTLVYRHIFWLYALKRSMEAQTAWEHQDPASRRQRQTIRRNQPTFEQLCERYRCVEEPGWVESRVNLPSQLLDKQTQHLARLHRQGLLDNFRHVELQRLITELYGEQGRSERIKNTPLPRQYATTSRVYLFIFIVLLPFGMISEFHKMGEGMIWLLLPLNLVVSLVYMLMEYTGDNTENPFEGLITDIPVASIIRNIEIDLLQMLGETDLPEKVQARFGILQ